MNIFDFFKTGSKKSASKAKERLQIVISHQQASASDSAEFLANMKADILTVIGKYVDINPEDINVQLQKQDDHSILELNVTLPDQI